MNPADSAQSPKNLERKPLEVTSLSLRFVTAMKSLRLMSSISG